MKFRKLVTDCRVSGSIRISAWDDGNEEESVFFDGEVEDAYAKPSLIKSCWNREVISIFCPGDGKLHIELRGGENA